VANVLNAGELVAFAYNLGTVSSSTNVTFAIGNYRNQSVLFTAKTANTPLSAFFTATYPTLDTAFQYFMSSYKSVSATSSALDTKIRTAAEKISSHYADMGEYKS